MAQQNLALNRPTSSSSYVKPYESARAVNGTYGAATPTSRWLCNTLPGWMMVDLGFAYWINRWVVRHMPVAGWATPNYSMSDFKLQGSNDNAKWYDIDSVVGNTSAITDRTLVTAVAYRYLRLYVTKGLRCNTQLASAMEFEVYQSPPLSAYLKSGTGLVVSSGALTPAFVNTVFNYTTPNVPNSVTSVTVTPTAEDSRATIKVNGVVVTSGNSTNVALNVGSNAISVQVTAADGLTTNTYTVMVVRNAVAYLTGLALNTTATPSVAVPYTPTPFNKDFTAYSASVGYDVSQIVVTPTTDISGATITVNGAALTGGSATVNLNVGSNTISIVVTSGTATKTYTVTVTRTAALTGISAVTVVGTTNTPITLSFDKSTLTYTGTIEYSDPNFLAQNIAVTPVANADTVIKYQGNVIASGTAVPVNNPPVGLNTVSFVVSAPDGTGSATYTVNITRNHSTFLKTITTSKGTINPTTITKTALTYTVKAGAAATNTTLTLTAEEVGNTTITLNVDSTNYTSTTGTLSQFIPISSTAKTATVTVTSSAGAPQTVYTIYLSKV